MPPASVRIAGRGLHSGRPVAVTLSRREGPVVLATERIGAPLSEYRIRDAHRGVRVGHDGLGMEVESVEHLFAALGAWPVRRGLEIVVEGGEVPLVDGGAAVFAETLARLGPPRSVPVLAVRSPGTVEIGDSVYAFAPAERRTVEVEIDFDAPAIGVQRARWDGTFDGFASEIAWARTFGFRRDARALFAAGRALGADAGAVMVLDENGRAEPPGAAPRPLEFARHKLLDLMGDLYLFGGPPQGAVFSRKPGHAATHRAVAAAVRRGLLVSDEARIVTDGDLQSVPGRRGPW